MTQEKKISVCFFTRRYDDLLIKGVFEKKFKEQYFWVKHADQLKFAWIFGAPEDRTLNHPLGPIYFVKDYPRTKLLVQKNSFYKNSQKIIEEKNINLVVCNGMNDIGSHYLLSRKLNIPSLLQDHATSYRSKYKLVSRCFKEMDGFIFNSPGQEEPWVNAKLMPQNKVNFLPEGVSPFQAKDKSVARSQTKLNGDPILLWVGNLVPLKDPMTCLKAIQELTNSYPDLKVYMVYQKDDLLNNIKSFIDKNKLEKNIFLLGFIKHDDIESYFQSADYYISSSLKEGSGYAAIEAMACNTIPILSNIPSFIDFTDNGNCGVLFKQKDHKDLIKKTKKLFESDINDIRNKLRRHYLQNFSPNALANKFTACVKTILHDS